VSGSGWLIGWVSQEIFSQEIFLFEGWSFVTDVAKVDVENVDSIVGVNKNFKPVNHSSWIL